MRWRLKLEDREEPVEVTLLTKNETSFTFKVGDEVVTLTRPENFPFSIRTAEIRLTFEVWQSRKWRAVHGADTFTIEPLDWGAQSSSLQNEIRSEMPGRILKILVKPGDKIVARQPLVIIEAMKMENEIRATGDAIVKNIAIQPGQSVESGTLLIELLDPS